MRGSADERNGIVLINAWRQYSRLILNVNLLKWLMSTFSDSVTA